MKPKVSGNVPGHWTSVAHIVNLFPVFVCVHKQFLGHFPVGAQQRLVTMHSGYFACSQTLLLKGKNLSVDKGCFLSVDTGPRNQCQVRLVLWYRCRYGANSAAYFAAMSLREMGGHLL